MVICIRQCYPPNPCHPLSSSVSTHPFYICVSIPALQLGSSVPFFFSRFHIDFLYFSLPELRLPNTWPILEKKSPLQVLVLSRMAWFSVNWAPHLSKHALHSLLVSCLNSFSAGQHDTHLDSSEKNSMFSFMFAFSRINDFLSFNFYFWNLNKHWVLETVTLFSSVGINYFKMSPLKEYQLSALTHELPLTKTAQKLYQFLLTNALPFSMWGMFQADSGTIALKWLDLRSDS